MFSNYLKIAWRSLLKNRLFTLLNSLGLAIGLAVALLLLLYATDELAFDKYHSKADRIARVNLDVTYDGQSQLWGNAPNRVGPTMKAQIPGVENQVRLLRHNFGRTAFVNSANREFAETKLYWADSTLFGVFDVPLLLGNPKTALAGPNRVVLSQHTARRYFGMQNPLGKLLDVDHKQQLEVTGVYADLPATSSLDADLIGSFASVKWASDPTNQSWSNASFETYLLLRPNVDRAQLERQMETIVAKNVPKADRYYTLYLQPLTDIHLYSANLSNVSSTRIGDARQVTMLLLLAVVVLLIACINYMNLTTAQAQVRAKEVGINKVAGATRTQLMGRFYAETLLVVAISLLVGVGLVVASLPLFNTITAKALSIRALATPGMLLCLLGLGITISLLAGGYPAFVLSGFSIRGLLQSSFRAGSGGGFLRRSLVVTQFVASLVLIISTLLFYRQLQFIQQRKLGYNPTQVVAITTAAAQTPDQVQTLGHDLRALSSVDEISRAQVYPGGGGSGRSLSKPGGDDKSYLQITTNRVNSTFIKVLGLKLLAGRTLSAAKSDKPDTENETDTTVQVVLNKTAVDFLGYTPEQAIGKMAPGLFGNSAEIVGVVDDFHFESLHKPIGAYAFHNANTESRPFMLVKVRTQNLPETMQQLEALYRKDLPNSAFEYTFLDTYLNTLYRSEQRMAQVVLIFAGIAILIACLGLFGLATFTAEQRTKEIGVRKVLGASVSSIVALLSKDFLKLVLIAIVLAVPLAWWAISSWLADFAYRVDVEWWVFAGAGALVVFIALLTVSFQSIKAALMNPVQSLRSE